MSLLSAIAAARKRGGAANPLWDNLVAYWKLDEASGSGDRVDIGPNGLDLTAVNSPSQGTGLVHANCADLEAGSSQSFSHADDDLLSLGTVFTIAGWFNAESLSGTETLLSKAGEYNIYHDSGSIWAQLTHSGGSVYLARTAPSTGTWTSFVVTADGSNATLSLNAGTRTSTSLTASLVNTTNDFMVGAYLSILPWDGLIGPIALLGQAWTTDEEAEFYNSGSGTPYTP